MNRLRSYTNLVFQCIITIVCMYFNANANAPSVWLYPSGGNGDILMQDVRVPYATSTTYYCILQWNAGQEGGGYCGVQATKHVHFAIWDPSNSQKIQKVYATQNCSYQSFGGEGTGMKSQWTYTWPDNVWLTHVVRTWNCNNHTYFGFWFKDSSTSIWTHVLTYDYPVANVVFKGTGTFLEDYGGNSSSEREMHVSNGWKRVNGSWVAFQKQSVSANGGSAWNGGKKENYFFMEAGGNSSGGSSGSHTITLSTTPQVPAIRTTTYKISYSNPSITASWETDETKAPQFGYAIGIYDDKNCTGNPLFSDIKSGEPDIRSAILNAPGLDLINKQYFAKLTLTDILDQKSDFIKEFGATMISINSFSSLRSITIKNNRNGDLQLHTLKDLTISFEMYNSYGRKMYSIKDLALHKGLQTIFRNYKNSLGCPTAKGIYVCKLTVGSVLYTSRVVMK